MTVCLISSSAKINDSKLSHGLSKLKSVILGHSRPGANSGPEVFIENYREIAMRSHQLLINIDPGPVLKCAPGHHSMFGFIIV